MLEILRAARWAPAGGNKRLHRFIAVLDATMIRLIRSVSPGMAAHPTGLVVICIDWEKVRHVGYRPERSTVYVDVGTSAQNMLLAAHALGLGAGPVTSFCKEAVALLLRLPEWLSPEMIIVLGYPAPREPSHQSKPRTPTKLKDLVVWERFSDPRVPNNQ
jgi:nitroreductase